MAEQDYQYQTYSQMILQRVYRRIRSSTVATASACFLVLLVLVAIAAPRVATHDPLEQNMRRRFDLPSRDHLLGTDVVGRDIFSRIVYGSRISLFVGVSAVLVGTIVGVALGLLSGYSGGIIDSVTMRFIDLLLSFPGVLLAITIAGVLGPGLTNVIIAVGIWSVPTFARLTRGSVLSIKETEYVEAAVASGASTARIMSKHILRNCFSPILVYATMLLGSSILTAAALSFLGLGIPPPAPEWGAMVATGRHYVREAPHSLIIPGLTIFFTVFSFNFIGDALRDALDPKI